MERERRARAGRARRRAGCADGARGAARRGRGAGPRPAAGRRARRRHRRHGGGRRLPRRRASSSTPSRPPRCGSRRRCSSPTTRSTRPSPSSASVHRGPLATAHEAPPRDRRPHAATSCVEVLDLADRPRPARRCWPARAWPCCFEKPSARTRNSMEMAVVQLGGHPVTIRRRRGRPRPAGDRRGRRPHPGLLPRRHRRPGLRPREARAHGRGRRACPSSTCCPTTPTRCQALADLLTMRQEFGDARRPHASPTSATATTWPARWPSPPRMVGMQVRIASPPGYEPAPRPTLDRLARARASSPELHRPSPTRPSTGADVVYTDVWTSMGQEAEAGARREAFEGFTVDDGAHGRGRRRRRLPALPARPPGRGGRRRGARRRRRAGSGARPTNRMHAARGLLAWLLEQP